MKTVAIPCAALLSYSSGADGRLLSTIYRVLFLVHGLCARCGSSLVGRRRSRRPKAAPKVHRTGFSIPFSQLRKVDALARQPLLFNDQATPPSQTPSSSSSNFHPTTIGSWVTR